MNLFLKIEDGTPVNHPQLEANIIDVYGSIPVNFEPFTRVERPLLGDEDDEENKYKTLVSEQPVYQQVDGVWTEVWSIRDMTAEEKTEKDALLDAREVREMPVSEP